MIDENSSDLVTLTGKLAGVLGEEARDGRDHLVHRDTVAGLGCSGCDSSARGFGLLRASRGFAVEAARTFWVFLADDVWR